MNIDPQFAWIDVQAQDLRQRVQDWSHINSGTLNTAGLAQMHSALVSALAPLAAEIESIELKPKQQINDQGRLIHLPLGKALRARKRPAAKKQLLFCGHMDTVFSVDHSFQNCTLLDSNTLNGPGVADMKGGLLVMMTALQAFEQTAAAQEIGWEILIVPDEELGSPGSAPLLKESAMRADIGFIYEPTMPDGALAGARKGSGNFSLVVRGKAAHAGRDHHLGRNAIAALAIAMHKIDQLNGQCDNVTFNLGRIIGGGPSNIVANLAICHFNIRIQKPDDTDWCKQQLHSIVENINTAEGYSAELHGDFDRPPKLLSPAIIALFELLKNCGEQLGIAIEHKPTGGCCDGNNLAAAGLPNIDTLGVRGANIHSSNEFMLLDSLTERAKLSTLLISLLATDHKAWQAVTQHRQKS